MLRLLEKVKEYLAQEIQTITYRLPYKKGTENNLKQKSIKALKDIPNSLIASKHLDYIVMA